ncbi:MAG: class I SAM-dependent methyltransferase [Pirellulaceae bacterium]|nr:class I SAM-dependent methyltransferase [Pirellulaceae bacterium]
MTNDQPFGDLVDVYEGLVDWPRRLAHEEPFYRQLFATHSVQRLVDVACGTGHHAAMFHRWGLTVEGSDVSPGMIERASQLHGRSDSLRWTVRGFEETIDPRSPFDAAICVGNSLALAGTHETADRVIGRMLAAVRPGGLVVVHVLNLWHLRDGPCQWQKCRRMPGPDRDLLVVKGVHRSGSAGYVDLIVATLDEPPRLKTESVPLLGLEADSLERAARRSGATQVDLFGGYDLRSYQRETSADLIMVAHRDECPRS